VAALSECREPTSACAFLTRIATMKIKLLSALFIACLSASAFANSYHEGDEHHKKHEYEQHHEKYNKHYEHGRDEHARNKHGRENEQHAQQESGHQAYEHYHNDVANPNGFTH
jgi:Spy/CpxP family protein refolding chaperone